MCRLPMFAEWQLDENGSGGDSVNAIEQLLGTFQWIGWYAMVNDDNKTDPESLNEETSGVAEPDVDKGASDGALDSAEFETAPDASDQDSVDPTIASPVATDEQDPEPEKRCSADFCGRQEQGCTGNSQMGGLSTWCGGCGCRRVRYLPCRLPRLARCHVYRV